MVWYHFVGDRLRDGRPVPADGVWVEHDGPLVLCQSGLHASPTAWDALSYAPGPILCQVDVDGDRLDDPDKCVARRRRIVARFDAMDLLRDFARWCARDVLYLWDAPPVVRQYLETGEETLRAAAWDAAWDAARAAAWDAAGAARAAAWDAARAAAGDARAAAGDARAAAWDAARAAAWDARAAAGAARAAAGDARAAAGDAGAAAGDAARKHQRARFTQLVDAAFEGQYAAPPDRRP